MNIATLLLTFRKQIIGATILVVLFFGGKWYIHSVESSAYDQGFSVANEAWIKKGKEYVGMIDAGYRTNVDLQYKLQAASAEREKAKQDLQDTVEKGRQDYDKMPESKTQCLDPKFINVYNGSLGE